MKKAPCTPTVGRLPHSLLLFGKPIWIKSGDMNFLIPFDPLFLEDKCVTLT